MNQFNEEEPIQPPAKRTWYKRGEQPALDALPSAAAMETKPMRAPRKARSSAFRRLLVSFGVFLALLAAAVAVFFSLLRQDRVTAIAKQQIARLAGDGYETSLASASLSLFRGGIASVTIEGLSITDKQSKQPLLTKGNAGFAISLPSLLTGHVELTELSLVDAEINLASRPGQAQSWNEKIMGSDGLVDPALVSTLLDEAAASVSTRLAANPELIINATDTKLTLGNDAASRAITLQSLIASKALSGEFAFDASVATDNWSTKIRGAVGQTRADGKSTPYRFTVDPIPFKREFAAQAPDFKPRNCVGFVGIEAASLNGLASLDTTLSQTNCTLGALGDYAIDAKINGKLDRGSGVFEIGRGVVNVNRSVFNFDGAFAPARYTPKPENEGETPRYRYELVFSPSTMDSLDNNDVPLALEGKIAGTYAPSENRLALDEFTADANGSILRGAASLLFTDVTPALYLALTSDKMPIKDFKRIWPRFAASSPRRIVMERISSGTISNMRLELQLPPGKIGSRTPLEREQLSANGDVEGASFLTFGEFPPVKDARGRVEFDGKSVTITAQSGTIVTASGGQAALKPSSFVIADTHIKPVAAELKVSLSGKANVLAEIAAQKPIAAFKNENVTPADLSGTAEASGTIQLTLVPFGQKAPNPDYDVNVKVDNLSVAKTVNGQNISNASGTIKASKGQINVRLDADVSGIPAKIVVTEQAGSPEKRVQEIVLTLTDGLRNKFAPGLKGIITGPVFAEIKGAGGKENVELDLTKAELNITPFNWQKGSGISSKATFTLQRDGENISISNLKFTGRGLQGSGKAEINGGTLQSVDLQNIRLNSGDNFSLKLRKDGNATVASLGGAQLDARSILKQILPGRQPVKNPGSQAIAVSGKIGRLIGFNDETLLNAEVGFTPGKNAELSLRGDFENGGSIDVSRGERGLIVQTGNAGAALRFVDLYKRMVGGSLRTNFNITGSSKLSGAVSISDFTVIGEPRLARLASEQAEGSASLREATQADLGAERAQFELAAGDLVLDRGTISLSQGIVRGPNVGATAEGVVLSATGKMDLRGTFMPARGLNKIVGSIPILGLLLGSGNSSGLIGITYQLAGDAKNPKVFVNPISIIAPGVFRQIFE